MILKAKIPANVSNRGLEQASRVLEAQLLKYLESEIKSLMAREITRERVTSNST
jgi:hypothetical protein